MTYDYSLTIAELDGFPSGSPSKLIVPNGSLVDNGDGSFTLTASTSGEGVSVSDSILYALIFG